MLPDGRVWDGLRGLRKDNTGYDLKQLFIGSEGTLGVITARGAAALPGRPRSARTAWVAVADVAAAVTLLGLVQSHAGAHLSTFEIVNRTALDLVLDPPARLAATRSPMPATGTSSSSSAGTADARRPAGGSPGRSGRGRDSSRTPPIAGSPAQRSALWALREGISEAQKVEGATLKHDVTLPIGDLAAWTDRIAPALEAILPGVRLVTYGHVGDGNLHYNLSAPLVAGESDDDALRAAAGRPLDGDLRLRGRAPPGRSAPSTASARPRRRQRRRTSRRWRST